MRVLHVSQPVVGGVPRCVLDLVADQVGRGWDVAVACPLEGELAGHVRALGALHLPWSAKRQPGPSVVSETARLARLARDFAPHVLHLHSSKAGLCGRLRRRPASAVVFQPGGWSFQAVDGILRRASVAWERLSAPRADAVVCVSESERLLGEAAGVRARWYVVPNGVDLERHGAASSSARTAARARLGLDGEPLAVCVGRLDPAKGQDVLLEAWPMVREGVPAARLALVGEGPERPSLEAAASEGVELVGHREDVGEWLDAADVVAIPSRREAMSMAMLEAMAHGRSVVATNVPGAREAIGEDAGALVAVEEPGALAEALAERLLDSALTDAEGRAARARVESAHDLRRVTAVIAELYTELMSLEPGDRRAARDHVLRGRRATSRASSPSLVVRRSANGARLRGADLQALPAARLSASRRSGAAPITTGLARSPFAPSAGRRGFSDGERDGCESDTRAGAEGD